jgi:5'-methylthioinosine phosphorylase
MLGIIGGTGLTQLENLKVTRRQLIRTPYGEPSGPLTFGEIAGHRVVFIPRHGAGHTIPPHQVNYRANIWAMHSEGVKNMVAVATVGGISAQLKPGDIVLPNQLIDYTHGRKHTFFDGDEQLVKHIDFTEPYCANMRKLCLNAAKQAQENLLDGGVYAAVQGPRLETAAEINRLERDGATLVGMTGMPEAALARELEMRYAVICPVANHAAGRASSAQGIQYEQIAQVLEQSLQRVRNIIEQMVLAHAC